MTRIQRLVRDQIAGAIEDDLEHGESLMKECFEQMDSDEDYEACFAEMRTIVAYLRRGDATSEPTEAAIQATTSA